MGKGWLQIISFEGALALLVTIILALAEMTWIFRSILAAAGIGLIAYLAWRVKGPVWARVTGAVAVSVILVALSAKPIMTQFAEEHRLPIEVYKHPEPGSLTPDNHI
jgi:hypothetical protein